MRAYARKLLLRLKEAFRHGDWVLLTLCMVATAFGCLVIASATSYMGSLRHILVQVGAAVIGILLFFLVSSVDVDVFSEHRRGLVIFNIVLLFMLIPFGVTVNGNRSWVSLPILPFNIQVAEICKISYILITASVMNAHQNRISHVNSVFHVGMHLALIMGLNILISGDAGVSLIFFFIFVGMAYSGGVNYLWFLGALAAGIFVAPFVYKFVLGDYQKLRIEVLFNPDLDPLGVGPRYHTVRSLRSLTGGGMTGQGLFNGHRTQAGALFAQHTDYVFSAIGEELGYLGCIFVLVLLFAIVARCIWVGMKSPDYMRRLVCFGAASAMIFQIIVNVGMCIGVMPVIGLTLPFISYGGSSIVSTFLMLGLVSGVYARPKSTSHERYIRPPQLYMD